MERTMHSNIQRQTNRRKVYRYIYDSAQRVTAQEIAEAVSFPLPTVMDSLADLMAEGMVFCYDETYALEPQARIAVGLCMLDDSAQLLAIDMRAEVLGCRELPLRFSHTPAYYETVAQCLEEFLDDCGLDRGRLLGVGMAMPAIIDQAEGRLVLSPTLELWDISLEEIYCHFSHYSAFIENVPNASGYAERWAGGVRTNAVYLSLDRGVGGAILLGNEDYMGNHGRGGEFGHMCLVPNGRLCHCGRRGCVEAYCSTSRLSDDLGITLEEFFVRLQSGDEEAAAVWEEYQGHLADALVNLRTCFDCDIILGGALSPYLKGFLPELSWEVGEKTLFSGEDSFLYLDHFGARSACTGTALRFIDDFLRTY